MVKNNLKNTTSGKKIDFDRFRDHHSGIYFDDGGRFR